MVRLPARDIPVVLFNDDLKSETRRPCAAKRRDIYSHRRKSRNISFHRRSGR
jgi:hypothetical protein